MDNEQGSEPRRRRIWRGLRATAPVALGVVPFGIAFGAVADGAMASWQAVLMSTVVFSGTAQFVCASLLAQGVAPLSIWVTGVLINLRMMLMSAALTPYLQGERRALQPLFGHLLTDESFAVSMAEFEARGSDPWFFIGSGLAIFIVWQPATWVGLLFGAAIPEGLGLEYALPASLIVLLFLLLRDRAQVMAAAAAAVAVLAVRPLVSATWSIMVATLGVATVMVLLRAAPRGLRR